MVVVSLCRGDVAKSRNERNPALMLLHVMVGTRGETAVNWRRWGRQIIMPLMSWASRMLRWLVQRAAIL